MQQRQLRLGDILDDYCPRERRVTNHAIVAMVGPDVKQTRCTTCDAEHAFKHARVPRQRRKPESSAAFGSQAVAGAPKRVAHEPTSDEPDLSASLNAAVPEEQPVELVPAGDAAADAVVEASERSAESTVAESERQDEGRAPEVEEGPVHRPLIRATLPRADGQSPSTRPAPEFTIRQPAGRQNRFRPRHPRAEQQSHGNRWGGTRSSTGGMSRPFGGGQPPVSSRLAKRHGTGHKRSK